MMTAPTISPGKTTLSPRASEVAHHLLKLKAVKLDTENLFTWVSGVKSPIYCDNRVIGSYPDTRNLVTDAFVELISREFPDVQCIAGVATGGIPYAVLVADRLNLPFVYVRQEPKAHGMMKQVEGDFAPGQKVVLIEDHISTGGSSLKAYTGLKNAGMNVLALISIMTYGFDKANRLFASENVNYLSLCDLDTVLDVASDQNRISTDQKTAILAFRDETGK